MTTYPCASPVTPKWHRFTMYW